MHIKYLTLFVVFNLSFRLQALAQNPVWETAANDVVLIDQKEDIIPFKNLDQVRFSIYDFSGSVKISHPFISTFLKYTVADIYTGHNGKIIHTPASSPQNGQQQINILLFGEEIPSELTLLANTKSPETKTIAINTAMAIYKLPYFQFEKMDGHLYVNEPSAESMSYTAQVLFGALGAKGTLSKDLNEDLKKGLGSKSKGGIRLAYLPPEMAGMKADILKDSIQAIVEEGITAGAFPGAQVLVARKGKVIYHEAFGYHTFDSIQSVSTNDIYDLASVTKISTGLAALMKWYGEGKFDLDASLSTYMPYFKRSNKAHLAFREILAHHARLRPWIPYWQSTLKGNAKYPWKKRWDNNATNEWKFKRKTFAQDSSIIYSTYVAPSLWLHKDYKEQIYKAIRKSPLNEKKEYKYSGLFFYLLPDLVQQISGQDIETYLKNTFYKPLGAHTLTYNPWRYYSKDRIVPTERDTFFRMSLLHGRVHDEGAAMMGGVSCNAGLFACANDMAKLMQMYLNRGEYGGQRFIAQKAAIEFSKCQYCEEGNRRGLGFDKPLINYDPDKSSVAKDASPYSFGHSGYTGTFVWADPDSGLLFIFFSNRVYPTRQNRKIYELNIRPRIHQVLYDAIIE